MELARGCLPEDAVRFYFAELVNIVEYLHSKGIVHRDLKVFLASYSLQTCC
jgi:serine/threonine protein kinase